MPHYRSHPVLPGDLLKVVPVFGPDPRQELFVSDTESDEALITNLKRGFAASCPDLGFLQWMTLTAVRREGMDRKTAFRATIIACVQRVEIITVKSVQDTNKTEGILTTNDDYGRYRHAYVVDFDVKSYPVPPLVRRHFELQGKEVT